MKLDGDETVLLSVLAVYVPALKNQSVEHWERVWIHKVTHAQCEAGESMHCWLLPAALSISDLYCSSGAASPRCSKILRRFVIVGVLSSLLSPAKFRKCNRACIIMQYEALWWFCSVHKWHFETALVDSFWNEDVEATTTENKEAFMDKRF